jgi:hypothetical protein
MGIQPSKWAGALSLYERNTRQLFMPVPACVIGICRNLQMERTATYTVGSTICQRRGFTS